MKATFRWLGAIVGLIVFVVVVGIAVGISVPIYHVASCSAQVPQAAHDLFTAVDEDAASTSWRSDLTSVRASVGDRGERVWVETYGSRQTMSYAEYERIPDRKVAREIDDPALPFGGHWEYFFKPDAAGTQVTITESGWIYNPVVRLVEQYFTGYTRTIDTYLGDLGRKYGQTPAIACTTATYSGGLPK